MKNFLKEKLSDKIEYLRYFLRWNFWPALILFGGIYIVLDFRYTELAFYLSLVGVLSLALWANHNRPKSYSDYLKGINQDILDIMEEEDEAKEKKILKKKYFNK